MKKVRHYQNNFTKGEFEPSLWGQGNLSGYYEALASAENVWVTSSGSVAKRYGMVKIKNYPTENYIKLVAFSNVSGSHFLLSIYAGKIDILNAGTGDLVASVDAPAFQSHLLPDLYVSSYQDSVIFTHSDIPPMQMKWLSGNNFQLTEIHFTSVPTFEFSVNDSSPNATLTPTGNNGFIRCTSSSGVFQSSDVGKYISMLPVGRMRISSVNSATVVNGFLEENLFDTAAIPSGNWTLERGWEPLWGSGNGYPAVSGFHEGRLSKVIICEGANPFAHPIIPQMKNKYVFHLWTRNGERVSQPPGCGGKSGHSP